MKIYVEQAQHSPLSAVLLMLPLLLLMLLGCSKSEYQTRVLQDVEIATGKWLELERAPGRAWFRCKWNGRTVSWLGEYDGKSEGELPISLREWNGNLFLIVFDSEGAPDMNLLKYKFSALIQDGMEFEEIDPSDYPRKIATQNLQMAPRYLRTRDGQLDTWELARKLDYSSIYFWDTDTGKIWIQLETGKSWGETYEMEPEQLEKIVREYAETYKPVSLPTIVGKVTELK